MGQWVGNWTWGFGDPDLAGWFITGSYLFSALVALLVALPADKERERIFRFWLIISVLMLLLGINKQLDLHKLMTEIGRQAAREGGWIQQRRVVQFWFILSLGLASAALFSWLAFRFRDLFRRFGMAFCGLSFLLTFIVVRAASFHHFDQVLMVEYLGMKVNWMLELIGIYLIMLAGIKEMVRSILRYGE